MTEQGKLPFGAWAAGGLSETLRRIRGQQGPEVRVCLSRSREGRGASVCLGWGGVLGDDRQVGVVVLLWVSGGLGGRFQAGQVRLFLSH